MRKSVNYCYLLFLILLFIKGHKGFFIKHSSGLCLQPALQYWVKGKDTGPLDGQWGPLYHVYFQNTCLHHNAQFRFFEPFSVLYNIRKDGTFLASTEYSEQFYIFHSPHAKIAGTFIYSAQFALKQTSAGALKLNTGYCATPVKPGTNPKSPLIPINGSLVYQTNRCDQEEQKFVFGSVTCEGKVTTDVNCHLDQVMVIQNAIYGGRRDMKTCGYNKNNDCFVSVKYLFKRLCDGKQKCAGITVSNRLFSDPCPGTLKYLYLEYICADKKEQVNQLCDECCNNCGESSKTAFYIVIAILVIIIAVLIGVIVYLTVCRQSTHTQTTEDNNVGANVVNESFAGEPYEVPLSEIGQNREDNNRLDGNQYDELQNPRNDKDEHVYQSLQK